MSHLIQQTRKRNSNCHISVVISNNPNALGVNLARSLGVDSIVIPHGNSREEFEKRINQVNILRKTLKKIFFRNLNIEISI